MHRNVLDTMRKNNITFRKLRCQVSLYLLDILPCHEGREKSYLQYLIPSENVNEIDLSCQAIKTKPAETFNMRVNESAEEC